ncbi:F-box/FBD/LRR-repeat protein At4g26340-like [Lotus japonicus]|uniref:F-box/FBD/LRR-repeat protein At4g26340-like n=1 Tax=Lotus japonicus TaxID=34305 RepID=UPI0025894FB6|nr:F-box/FBD/LRR-repeat protein At4g26340-like [Lotus japonicus]
MADKISMLPDDVACHILSFLPTQDVVATSLLSKRWMQQWLPVPSLYFDDRGFLKNKKPYDPALRRLKVDVFSYVDLPLLKTIYLDEVIFPEWKYVVKLLSRCPIVENMHVNYIGSFDDPPHSNENFKNLSKLVRADIHEVVEDIPLKAICNVELLRIDKYTDDVPIFPNLTHLELICGSGMNWNLVLKMLKQCPKLQNFVLNMRTCYASMVWAFPDFVPKCLSSQLMKFSVKCCKCTEGELHFVKYIMHNAGVLRAVTICTWHSIRIESKFEMLRELSLCPRSSSICEFSFK